jgi:predicted Zn-dependent protease
MKRLVVVAGLSLLWCATHATEETVRRTPIAVTPVQEEAWGEKALASFFETRRQSGDGNLGLRVDRVGRAVARVSERPNRQFRFILVEGEEPQAFSFPGRTVCVTEALARLLPSDDQLAFALGHELAHIALRHHVSQLKMQQALEDGAPADQALLETVSGLFDKDSEMEADRFGALYAVRAGYAYTSTYGALGRVGMTTHAGQSDRRHPDFEQRVAALRNFKVELTRALGAFDGGVVSLRAGDAEDAIEMLNLFVAEFPRSVSGRVNLGAAYLRRVRQEAGTPQGLAEVLLPIISDPGIVVRGIVDTLDLAEAQGNFERALDVRPDEVLAQAGLGLVHTRMGRFDEARDHFKRARKEDPNNPDVTLCLGNVEYLAGNYAKAVSLYRDAMKRRPGWPEATKNLALAYEKLGEIEQARERWSSLTDHDQLGSEARRRLEDLDTLLTSELDSTYNRSDRNLATGLVKSLSVQ